MADNSADRKSLRAREKAALAEATIRADVIRSTMSTPTGRHWMWTLLSQCHIFAQTFTSDPLTTAFNEGQRSIGLSLMADILRTCPDQYIQAQREQHDRDTLIEQRSGPIVYRGDPGSIDDPSLGSSPSGTSDPAPDGLDDYGSGIIGVDADVRPNGHSRPYRDLNHN